MFHAALFATQLALRQMAVSDNATAHMPQSSNGNLPNCPKSPSPPPLPGIVKAVANRPTVPSGFKIPGVKIATLPTSTFLRLRGKKIEQNCTGGANAIVMSRQNEGDPSVMSSVAEMHEHVLP